MTLGVLRNTGQVFCSMSLNQDLPDVFFSWLDWGYRFWGGSAQGESVIFIELYPGHILSTWLLIVDIDLSHLPERVFVRFHYNVILFPFFPYCPLWKEVRMWSPHLRSRKLCLTTLRVRISTQIIWDSSALVICLIFLFIQSVINITMNSWILTLFFGFIV